jgi:hypothetical protein
MLLSQIGAEMPPGATKRQKAGMNCRRPETRAKWAFAAHAALSAVHRKSLA